MICATCGQENPAAFRFCGACGSPLPLDPTAEVRKTVTVVFCDMVGSTAIGERSDPEVLRELMGRYHAELRVILERHGGRVEKFVGDAAMAVFGLPQLHEDDALRAVRAAVEMREAVAPLGLEVRTGVNTGEVVAGLGETLVTGDAVNVAARLEQAAGAGEVLIGAATERLVRGAVSVEAVQPLALKGKAEPVPAFRVVALTDDIPEFRRASGSTFVGRERELGELEGSLAAAVRERVPRIATVVGPPGIGKSRLVDELVTRTGQRVVRGRCLSYGEGITYWPLREIVEQLGDLGSALEPIADAELAARRIAIALGSGEGIASPEEIAWGFRRLFEALAGAEPLIAIFEDIQWAEQTLLDLVEYVGTFARGASLLVICTARPELFDAHPAWTAPRPNATLVRLEPLAAAESEALVAQLTDLPPERRAGIMAAAEGNPLFVEQLVAMQAETGAVGLGVPPTLQALLSARVDGLAAPEREVAERGAVEGTLFHRGAVAELMPEADRASVGRSLLTLMRKDLVRPDHGIVPGDDGFRFGHGLIRDAAYQALPKRQRAVLHERYAAWLIAKLDEDAPAEIVGYHLEQAHRYGSELGGADPDLGVRAATALVSAARASMARQDVRARTSFLERSLALVPVQALRRRVLRELGDACMQAGEYGRAHEAFDEARSLASAAGDEQVEWLARLGVALIAIRQQPEGAAPAALAEGGAAIAARGAHDDHLVLARAWQLIAEAHLLQGDAVEQAQAYERAMDQARQASDLPLELELLMHSVAPIIFGPVPVPEAMVRIDGVVERLGDVPAVQGFSRHVRGHLLARLGQFRGALEELGEWRNHLRELGQQTQVAVTAGCVWDVCLWAGEWGTGERALLDGYRLLEEMGEKSFRSTVAAYLGEAVCRQGRFDEAERWSILSEELGSRDDRVNEASWRILRAKARAARGDRSGGEELVREALEIAEKTDYVELAAAAWLDLAGILAADRTGEARSAAARAQALYERKGNIVGARRAAELVERLEGSSAADGAQPAADRP